MRYAIFLVFIAVSAHADPCTDQSRTACTPDIGAKNKIITALQNAYDEYAAAKIAERLRGEAAAKQDVVAEAARNSEALEHEANMRAFFTDAISLTMSSYHVGPTATKGPVVAPKDPQGRGAWSAGIEAEWKPEVIFETSDIHEMSGPRGGGKHYGGDKLDPSVIAGYTYPDGTVKIMAQTLFDALNREHPEKANPGIIAAIIDHEAQHFNDLLTRGFSSKEECELRAYTAELRDADIFELTTDQKKVIWSRKDRYSREFQNGLRKNNLTSYFPDEAGELSLSIAYDEAQQKRRAFEARSRELERLADEEIRRRAAQEHDAPADWDPETHSS